MSFITISKQKFYHNLEQIALKTGAKSKIAIVLKDNAYGHGLSIMAKLASEFGILHAVVRNTSEAEQIESLFDTVLILGDTIMNHPTFSFAINRLEDIATAEQGAKVELKVDTGMHRNGIAIDELEAALNQIKAKGLDFVGVMSHYRSADELSSEFFWQKKNFERVQEAVKQAGFENVRFHSHNSAAILRAKSFDEDLVRVGIGAYGYNELPEVFDKVKLQPVLALYAKKTATRTLKKGQRVGYGGDFIAPKDMTVSTYDLGYGDGWSRANASYPYITAENLPFLGRVSMDFVSLESTLDEVCIMNNAHYTAKQLGMISYEITTALHPHIKRVVV